MQTEQSAAASRPHKIHSDGTTVWINGAVGLLGRFGRTGIDIHRELDDQLTNGECLYCTHSRTTREDWDTFVVKMKEHFDIDVPSKYMPKRFR